MSGASVFAHRRRVVLAGAAVLAVLVALYVVVPAIAGLDETWRRLSSGDAPWLLAALAFEILSYGSYMALLRTVCADASARIDWLASYRVTMAGVVASRLFALAGAGGIVVTAWALGRFGMGGRELAARLSAFFILLYGVYMAAMVVGGLGLAAGVFPGPAPPGLTVVPAIFGAVVIATVLATAALAPDLETAATAAPRTDGAGRVERWVAAVPATISSGVRTAIGLLRAPRPGLLGSIGWFAFDIAVLWASLNAFGAAPPVVVVVMAYFVGMTANTLPVPGGVGAVEGGMVGALIGFGVEGGLAIVAVLSYRAFAFWLPMIPGAIAYVELLRSPERPESAEEADRGRGDRTGGAPSAGA